MLKNILPNFIFKEIEKYDFSLIQEIRLRINTPIILIIDSNKKILQNISNNFKLTVSKDILDEILLKSSNYSLYSIQNQIQEGYITLKNGIRLGLSGEFSFDTFNIKSIQGINIRIPHQIKNCSKSIFDKLFFENQFLNTLIISPPGAGKTTFIRDILYQFNFLKEIYNVTLIDERNEISSLLNGYPTLKIYDYCDIISHLKKEKGILLGIKNLNPEIIVTDEISSIEDIDAIEKTSNMGVKLLSSIHAYNLEDLKQRKYLSKLIDYKIFERYVILSKKIKIGEIVGIYDKDFNKI